MKKLSKTFVGLILVALLIFTTTPFAFAEQSKMDDDLLNAMSTAEGTLPVCVFLTNGKGSHYSVNEIYDIVGPMWEFTGTYEKWWEAFDLVAKQKVQSNVKQVFEECGIDVKDVEYIVADSAHLLTVEQINALAQNDNVTSLRLRTITGKGPYQRGVIYTVTAADALKTLQSAVGKLPYKYNDLDRDGFTTVNEALTVLECAVGKRFAGMPEGYMLNN